MIENFHEYKPVPCKNGISHSFHWDVGNKDYDITFTIGRDVKEEKFEGNFTMKYLNGSDKYFKNPDDAAKDVINFAYDSLKNLLDVLEPFHKEKTKQDLQLYLFK